MKMNKRIQEQKKKTEKGWRGEREGEADKKREDTRGSEKGMRVKGMREKKGIPLAERVVFSPNKFVRNSDRTSVDLPRPDSPAKGHTKPFKYTMIKEHRDMSRSKSVYVSYTPRGPPHTAHWE